MLDTDFETACLPHRSALLQRALRLVNSNRADAEDLVQDVMIAALAAWRARGSNPAPENPGARSWLMRLLMNTFVSHYRKVVGRREAIEDYTEMIAESTVGEIGPAPDAGVYARQVRSVVHDALDILPERQRDVVERYAFDGQLCHEIAEDLDMPIGTVFPTLSRARTKLAVVLDDVLADVSDEAA